MYPCGFACVQKHWKNLRGWSLQCKVGATKKCFINYWAKVDHRKLRSTYLTKYPFLPLSTTIMKMTTILSFIKKVIIKECMYQLWASICEPFPSNLKLSAALRITFLLIFIWRLNRSSWPCLNALGCCHVNRCTQQSVRWV